MILKTTTPPLFQVYAYVQPYVQSYVQYKDVLKNDYATPLHTICFTAS